MKVEINRNIKQDRKGRNLSKNFFIKKENMSHGILIEVVSSVIISIIINILIFLNKGG